MIFDKKEEMLLQEYKNLIENNAFDEVDVFSFLIFIREQLRKSGDHIVITDLCDTIAHRHRDRGKVFCAIQAARKNEYQTIEGTKFVRDYQGVHYSQWEESWKKLGEDLNIIFSDDSIFILLDSELLRSSLVSIVEEISAWFPMFEMDDEIK